MKAHSADWTGFFDQWAAISLSNDDDKWHRFFSAFRQLRPEAEQSTVVDGTPGAASLDINSWCGFFSDFSPMFKDVKAAGQFIDFWEVAGLGCSELRNSQVLAWLLNCFSSHGQGPVFLKCLLDTINETGGPHISKSFPRSADVPEFYTTALEKHYDDADDSGSQSRVDIEIKAPGFLLMIEVKIWAGENKDQLQRYYNHCRALGMAQQAKWGLIFLTPDKRKPRDGQLEGLIPTLSWRQLAGVVKRCLETSRLQPCALTVLHQYCTHITRFV